LEAWGAVEGQFEEVALIYRALPETEGLQIQMKIQIETIIIAREKK
jgi:hypothetical protein